MNCPHCGSTKVKKNGIGERGQRYKCNSCNKYINIRGASTKIEDYLTERILILDIETAPTAAFVWGRWNQNIAQNQVISEGYVLCYAAKWLGSSNCTWDALPFYEEFQSDREDDYNVIKSVWNLLDKCDIVIAHNGLSFDIPTLNSRFIYHGLTPPSPYKIVDTLKIARQNFKFPSNRLDSLGEYLGIGRKVKNDGMDLWTSCMKGNEDSWADMGKYNIGDVELLEKIYLKLRAWDKSHPSVSVFEKDNISRCCVCGSEKLKQHDQNTYTNLSSFVSYQCQDCGHWNRGRVTTFSTLRKSLLLMNSR